MTLPTTFMIDAPGDAVRAAELRRIKWLATLLLATTFALFIAARAFVHVHPTLGFVAAFAAAILRLHRTVPAVEGGAATVRPVLGPRNQARRLPADGAPGWRARPLLHTQRP